MSVKEIKEAIGQGKVYFGIRQALKHVKNLSNVFIAKDTRDETVEMLDASGVEFIVLKFKEDLSKELNLDFECEVFSIASKDRISVKVKK
ncbi:hypothetical protein KAI32_01895 [Candidatus Pacearchaeota archaeon]|nr:hypothetical protein [Candidatus Pacearchaeota archaeon]